MAINVPTMYDPYPYTQSKIKIFTLIALLPVLGLLLLWQWLQPIGISFDAGFIANLNALKYIILVFLFFFFLKIHQLLVSRDHLLLLIGVVVYLLGLVARSLIAISPARESSANATPIHLELAALTFFLIFFTAAAFSSGVIIPQPSRKKNYVIVLLTGVIASLIQFFISYLLLDSPLGVANSGLTLSHSLEILCSLLLLVSGAKYLQLYRRTRFDIYFWFILASQLFIASLGYSAFQSRPGDFWNQSSTVLNLAGFVTLMWIPFLEHTRFMEPEIKLRKMLEKSLFQSEQHLKDYSNLVNRVDVGICTFDEQGKIIFCNQKLMEMLGYSPGQLIGQRDRELFNQKDMEKFKFELDKWKTGVGSKFEIDMQHQSRRAIPVMMSGVPVFDLSEKFTGSRIAIFEMSEWKHVENALRSESDKLRKMVDKRSADLEKKTDELIQAKTYYETLISGMLDILLVIDKKGNCNFINKYGRELIGYKASELTRAKLPNFLSDLEQFRKNYGDAMKVELHDYEASLTTKDGKEILCSWNVRYLFDAQGNHIGAMCVGRDISESRHVQSNLQKHSKNLEQLIAARTEELSARIDQLSKILKIGEEMTLDVEQQTVLSSICQTMKTLGWKVVVLAMKESKTTECRPVAYAGIAKGGIKAFVHRWNTLFENPFQYLKDEMRVNQSYFVRQISASVKTASKAGETWGNQDVLVIPIKFKSRIHGFIMLFEPDTAKIPDAQQIQLLEIFVHKAAVAIENRQLFEEIQSRSRDLERANKLQSEFFTTMSHELRTPLNSILTLTSVLLRKMSGELNAEQMKQLRIIQRNGDNLLRLINNLLDLSKIEAGRMESNPAHFQLRKMIRATLESIHPLCQRKKIKLELRLDKNLPEYLFSDEEKMRQVFINVLNNAIKFTEKGKITFSAQAEKRGAKIGFTIADTGIGMTPQEIDSIFEPYRQIDKGEKRNTGGTGLGLSISKQLWELLGGTISLTSTKGKGTEVVLNLPVQKFTGKMESRAQTPVSAARQKAGEKSASPSSRKKTVLLVDDNPDNQYAAKFILEDRGYRVIFARDGGEGVEKAIQLMPDLILMDMMMPGMDGYQATRKIRAEIALKNVPIIAMTAKTVQEDKQQAIKSGCNEYLTKPFNLDELTRKIDKWLKGSK